jgi:hypothetical protein
MKGEQHLLKKKAVSSCLETAFSSAGPNHSKE